MTFTSAYDIMRQEATFFPLYFWCFFQLASMFRNFLPLLSRKSQRWLRQEILFLTRFPPGFPGFFIPLAFFGASA